MQYELTRKAQKLADLARIEGVDHYDELLEMAATDSVCPAICMNRACDYTAEMEPDQRGGFCENCSDNTMVSILVLADLV